MTAQGPKQPRPSGGQQRPADDRWRSIGREFGLYTVSELADRLRFGAPDNLRAKHLTGKARVLAVADNGTFLYPGFQFDADGARMVPVVKDIVRQGRLAGWTDEELVLWFCRPSKILKGKRPVDVLGDEEAILRAAEADFPGGGSPRDS
ncbi:hypothetical protein H9639_15095 [Arthrobacter sp. Sa2CUA1]|uniref:DUF2384 domain-containing protein n=1 Tax=Arthrobacter gallicola TaxID=2762225 RepID=A0ABR8UVQ3_9MICC|nr:hypothetical protein [Arthrobacter gallicola]MBD7996623.1 hypothetical protein [Arthrobacter gallicola]